MDSKIEHIIRNNQYFELNETQKKLIAEWAQNSDEYEALQNTLLATDEFISFQKKELNPTLKQRLDVRFAEKHDQNRLVWYNKLWLFLWPENSPIYKRPLIQFAAICLVVLITVPLFPDMNKQRLAMNEIETKETTDKFEEEQIKREETKQPSEKSEERIDEDAKPQKQEINENQTEMDMDRNVKTKSAEYTEERANEIAENNGWELSDDEEIANAKGSSNTTIDMLSKPSRFAEDQKDVDDYADKLDMDAPTLEQGSSNDFRRVSDVYKKVETKETLDLLTALY